MTFNDAIKKFEHFFQEKTGVPWDMRLEPLPGLPMPEEDAPKRIGKIKKPDSNAAVFKDRAPDSLPVVDFKSLKFVYARPYLPRPLGTLPFGYILPEHRPGYVPPKVEMKPDYAVSFDTEYDNEIAGIKTDVEAGGKTQGECADDSPSNDNNVGWDLASEVGSDDDEDDDETESIDRSFSRALSHSMHFSTLRSESHSESSRTSSCSETGSTSTLHNSTPKFRSEFKSRHNEDRRSDSSSVYDSQTEESDDSLSICSHAPTNSTNLGTWRDSVSSSRSNSFTSSGSLKRESQRRGGKVGDKREIIEIYDSDEGGGAVARERYEDISMDEKMATLTPKHTQTQRRAQGQTQARNQGSIYSTQRRSQSQSTGQRQPSQNRGQFQARAGDDIQLQKPGRSTREETRAPNPARVSSSVLENCSSNGQSFQRRQANETKKHCHHRPQNEQMGYTSQSQFVNQGYGILSGNWGFASGCENGGYMSDMAGNGRMNMNGGGFGTGIVGVGGWDRGFGSVPNTASGSFGGNWGYGGMDGMNGAGIIGQFGVQGMGNGNPGVFNNGNNPPNGYMHRANGESGSAQQYGGSYANMAPLGNGPWGGNWGSGR